MTTGSALVNKAYREGNLINLGATITSSQETEGLEALNKFVDSLFGYELGEFAFDWPIEPRNDAPVKARYPLFPQDQFNRQQRVTNYPPPNTRILMNITADTTIWFPQAPSNGAKIVFVDVASPTATLTVQGNGRLILGSQTLADTPANLNGRQLMYRADLGNWIELAQITSTTESPFPSAYDVLLELGVLRRLAPRFGRQLSADQLSDYTRLMNRLKAQFKQETPAALDQYNTFLTPMSDWRWGEGLYYGGSLLE